MIKDANPVVVAVVVVAVATVTVIRVSIVVVVVAAVLFNSRVSRGVLSVARFRQRQNQNTGGTLSRQSSYAVISFYCSVSSH